MPHSDTTSREERPTRIKDIAKSLSLSTATVCRAMNNPSSVHQATRQRVLDAAARLNYVTDRSAKSLRTGRHDCLTAIIPYLDNPIYTLHADEARRVAEQHGYALNYHWGKSLTREGILRVLSSGTDGIILFGFHANSIECIEAAQKRNIPVLVLRWGDIALPADTPCTLDIDLAFGSQQAIEHLLELGHRRIGLLGISEDEHPASSHAARHRGITQAIRNAGLSTESLEYLPAGERGYEASYQAMTQRIASGKPLPTAIQASNDVRAVGALAALLDQGVRVPEDVSLIGFDNVELSQFVRPGLTTVSQSSLNIGTQAAEMMLQMIQSPREVLTGQLVPKLVVRQSTGPAPAAG